MAYMPWIVLQRGIPPNLGRREHTSTSDPFARGVAVATHLATRSRDQEVINTALAANWK